MTYTVKYSFGSDWHEYKTTDSIFEAKQAVKELKKRFRSGDGKMLGKIKIFENK